MPPLVISVTNKSSTDVIVFWAFYYFFSYQDIDHYNANNSVNPFVTYHCI